MDSASVCLYTARRLQKMFNALFSRLPPGEGTHLASSHDHVEPVEPKLNFADAPGRRRRCVCRCLAALLSFLHLGVTRSGPGQSELRERKLGVGGNEGSALAAPKLQKTNAWWRWLRWITLVWWVKAPDCDLKEVIGHRFPAGLKRGVFPTQRPRTLPYTDFSSCILTAYGIPTVYYERYCEGTI